MFSTTPSSTDLQALVPLLQASISPVTVISGVGLLLMSITNRYARVQDRVRLMLKDHRPDFKALKLQHLQLEAAPDMSQDPVGESAFLLLEIQILYSRALGLRWSIVLSLVCLFLVALTIALLFSGLLLEINLTTYICGSFLAALVLLLGSIGFFIHDIWLSLKALRLELDHYLP